MASPSGRENTARAEIAFARNQRGLVYASVDNAKGEVWRSGDSGATWQKLSNPQHLGGQGDYDNAIWVDPTDANHLLVAGLDIYESRDAGANFSAVSDWRAAPASPHADHHALVSPPGFGPANPQVFDGNDGGVYKAANVYALAGGTSGIGWTNVNNGLAITQFYSGAGRASAGGRILGGSQDNGSLQLTGGQWRAFRGGDGGIVAVDPASDLTMYGEYVYASVLRSLNGGTTSGYICAGIAEAQPADSNNQYCGAGATQKANFIAPFILDPGNSNRLLVGSEFSLGHGRRPRRGELARHQGAVTVHGQLHQRRRGTGRRRQRDLGGPQQRRGVPHHRWARGGPRLDARGAGDDSRPARAAHHHRPREPEPRDRRPHRFRREQRVADAGRRRRPGARSPATCPTRRYST